VVARGGSIVVEHRPHHPTPMAPVACTKTDNDHHTKIIVSDACVINTINECK
jgi:hypothetical protein